MKYQTTNTDTLIIIIPPPTVNMPALTTEDPVRTADETLPTPEGLCNAEGLRTADCPCTAEDDRPEEGLYNKIPGPLGLPSASLAGKVALVTGAGTSPFPSSQPLS